MNVLPSFYRLICVCTGFLFISSLGAANALQQTSAQDRMIIADLVAKVGTLEKQIRSLTGQLEEYDYKVRQQNEAIELLRKELELQREDMAAALQAQNAGSVEPAQASADSSRAQNPVPNTSTPEVTPTVAATVVSLPDGSASDQYKYAFAFIQKNDLTAGRTALEQFMKANADDPLVGNAKFWLGRIHLKEGRNGQAAQQLLSLVEEHPNHTKRADALVDLADALVKLGSSSDACNALAEFWRVNEDADNRLATRASRVSEAARCQ